MRYRVCNVVGLLLLGLSSSILSSADADEVKALTSRVAAQTLRIRPLEAQLRAAGVPKALKRTDLLVRSVPGSPLATPRSCTASLSNATMRKARLTRAAVHTRRGPPLFDMAIHSNMHDVVSKAILHRGRWEETTSPGDLHPRLLGVRGGTFVDVGSNLGYLSWVFAFYNFSVFAVEPMPHNRLAISTTLCMNPHFNSSNHKFILSSPNIIGSPGYCVMSKQGANVGNFRIITRKDRAACAPNMTRWMQHMVAHCPKVGKGTHGCEVIERIPLDTMLERAFSQVNQISRPVVIKMDIEGAECDALRTGQSIFTRLRADFVQIEGKNNRTLACARRAAAQHDYIIGAPRGNDRDVVLERRERVW